MPLIEELSPVPALVVLIVICLLGLGAIGREMSQVFRKVVKK